MSRFHKSVNRMERKETKRRVARELEKQIQQSRESINCMRTIIKRKEMLKLADKIRNKNQLLRDLNEAKQKEYEELMEQRDSTAQLLISAIVSKQKLESENSRLKDEITCIKLDENAEEKERLQRKLENCRNSNPDIAELFKFVREMRDECTVAQATLDEAEGIPLDEAHEKLEALETERNKLRETLNEMLRAEKEIMDGVLPTIDAPHLAAQAWLMRQELEYMETTPKMDYSEQIDQIDHKIHLETVNLDSLQDELQRSKEEQKEPEVVEVFGDFDDKSQKIIDSLTKELEKLQKREIELKEQLAEKSDEIQTDQNEIFTDDFEYYDE